MRKRQKEEILISFFKEKEKYEELAEYVGHLIRDDPSSPRGSLHTISYRIKDPARLIEKIEEENKQPGVGPGPITRENFRERVGDIVGIRLICLRLSDVETVEAYLALLAEEDILTFLRKPVRKRAFVLPVDPGEGIPEDLELRYSGYSSIHYQVRLGENSDASDALKGLQFELQLRTILEEAWGEIDHKYRYVLSRSGVELPEYIHTGFYNLSVYLQAAALQAEHLCRQAERYRGLTGRKGKGKRVSPHGVGLDSYGTGMDMPDPALLPLLQKGLEATFGFRATDRTLTYILRRLDEFGYAEQPQVLFEKILIERRLGEFKTILRDVLHREAFEDSNKRNVDAINAVNFALFDEMQGSRVAREGLRSVLRWRKGRSKW
ncbi:MAG: pyrophosphokinae [Thermodesulfobacteriota bacterium]|nr:pyrophosphokinae [Thermodesulfobacteriota bacterium]